MTWSTILPYFRTHLDALGLREWPEPFDATNVPSTLFEDCYNLELGDFTGEELNTGGLETRIALICRIFKKGFANPDLARDESVILGQDIVTRVLDPLNRLAEEFHNLEFKVMNIKALNDRNDKAHVIEMEFSIRAILQIC